MHTVSVTAFIIVVCVLLAPAVFDILQEKAVQRRIREEALRRLVQRCENTIKEQGRTTY